MLHLSGMITKICRGKLLFFYTNILHIPPNGGQVKEQYRWKTEAPPDSPACRSQEERRVELRGRKAERLKHGSDKARI